MKSILKIIISLSLICKYYSTNGQINPITYKIINKSFFNLNDLIESNKIGNNTIKKNQKDSTVIDTSLNKISFRSLVMNEYEEIGPHIVKINNKYIDKSNGKPIDLGLNLKLHDSTIFTGNKFINPYDLKSHINKNQIYSFLTNDEISLATTIPSSIIKIRFETKDYLDENATYLYDILNDTIKLVGRGIKQKINQNPDYINVENIAEEYQGIVTLNINSSYFLYGRNLLINRYNLRDVIDIKNITKFLGNFELRENSCITYNDSLIFFGLTKNYSLHKNEYDKLLYYSKENRIEINTEDFINNNLNKINSKNLLQNNNFEYSDNSKIEIIDNNLMNFDHYYVLVYNFKTNKIVGVLTRQIKPFKLINRIIIDKNNKLIVVNSADNYFTLFSIENLKEIITLKGNANKIDENNFLIVDTEFKSKTCCNKIGKNYEYPLYEIKYNKYDLNEIIEYNKYFQQPCVYKNINEFTTEKELQDSFEVKYKNNINLFLKINKPQILKEVTSKDYNSTTQSNLLNDKFIRSENLINKLNTIQKGLIEGIEYLDTTSHTVLQELSYYTYDQRNKEITYKSSLLNDNDPLIKRVNEANRINVWIKNPVFTPTYSECKLQLNYIDRKLNINLEPVDVNQAKNMIEYRFKYGIVSKPIKYFLNFSYYFSKKFSKIILENTPHIDVNKDFVKSPNRIEYEISPIMILLDKSGKEIWKLK